MSEIQDTEIKEGQYKPGELLENGKWRVETDSLGQVRVPADRLWGAQTQRSLIHFSVGDDLMPRAVYHAYGYVKNAAAMVCQRCGRLPNDIAQLTIRAADEVIAGKLDDEFPLYVWQTGSGTQSNMNVNEVISNRAIQMGERQPRHKGSDTPERSREHVAVVQRLVPDRHESSNDSFPTAMHIATVIEFSPRLIPAASALEDAVRSKARDWVDVVKIGRTHLQDATPLTVGQEWSGYAAQLEDALDLVKHSMQALYRVAIGGTAVGLVLTRRRVSANRSPRRSPG